MKKTLISLLILILIVAAVSALVFVYQISVVLDFDGTSQKQFVIEKGQTLDQISQNLFDEKIIKSKFALKAYLYLRGWQSSVQAGTYILTPMEMSELAKTLVAGKVDNEISLRFIEGWTLKDMADYLVEQKIISQPDQFLNSVKSNGWAEDYEFLKNITSTGLEGFLFPDTYLVYKDANLDDILLKMLDNFDQKLTPALRTEITAQGKSLYDVIKMASIIEMEIPLEEDRKVVSGILWKRLDSGMTLQVDSSLKYVIGKKDSPALTSEELKIDSPYNTYQYRGLPPTPICNPGESAIRAAIYPKNSDFWYYLSKKDGETVFSKTLEEHQENVEKYLKK